MPNSYASFTEQAPITPNYGSLVDPYGGRPQEQVMRDREEESASDESSQLSNCCCVSSTATTAATTSSGAEGENPACCTTDCLCLPCNAMGSCLSSVSNCCQNQGVRACHAMLECCFGLMQIVVGAH